MAQSTLQPARDPAGAPAPRAPAWTRLSEPGRSHPEVIVALALIVLATVIVVWADTRPGFDPYGWLVWGHQTIAGSLNTNAAPSWKPLPYLFTVPYALFGHYELWLWMITSVAISLSGMVFAGRIAYRVVSAGARARAGAGALAGAGARPVVRGQSAAAVVAALFAAVGVLGIRDYSHYILSAQSDPMIVALGLGAIDRHLSGRPRWAFAFAVLASLGRPEIWPFLGLYSVWAWRSVPAMRRLIVAGIVLLLALWFGIPALTSRSPFVAGTNALGSGRALHHNRVFGTVDRFLDLHETRVELLALVSVGLALLRRDRVTLTLAAGAVLWVVLEIAFALHGWPGLPRYMFGAGALAVVVAAIGVGRVLADPPRISAAAGWAAIVLVVALIASLVPAAISRGRIEHKDLRVQRERTRQIDRLAGAISRAGGAARLRRCGEPLIQLEYQTILAWQLRVNVARVGFKFSPAVRRRRPVVLFRQARPGWKVLAFHQRLAGCRRLPH